MMFVNGIAFFTTISRDIRLLNYEHVPTQTAKQLSRLLIKIVLLYARGDFIIRDIIMDRELEKIKDNIGLVDVNTTTTREHVA